MVTTKCQWIPDVSTKRTVQPVESNMTHLAFNILNCHRHKTPAIARCFTFYSTVSPSRRKYMEEHRVRMIRYAALSY